MIDWSISQSVSQSVSFGKKKPKDRRPQKPQLNTRNNNISIAYPNGPRHVLDAHTCPMFSVLTDQESSRRVERERLCTAFWCRAQLPIERAQIWAVSVSPLLTSSSSRSWSLLDFFTQFVPLYVVLLIMFNLFLLLLFAFYSIFARFSKCAQIRIRKRLLHPLIPW